jgi:hypothetical protein
VNGTGRNRIAKVDEDGNLVVAFDPGSGFNTVVTEIVYDGSGGLYCVGQFTTYDGVSANRIVKLNTSDGTIDSSFVYGTGLGTQSRGVALGQSGYIYVSTILNSTYDGTSRNKIFKIETDGTLDPTFTPPSLSGVNTNNVRDLYYDSNQDIVFFTCPLTLNTAVAGFDGTTGNNLSSYDGDVNVQFPDRGVQDGLLIDNQGKILVVGRFTSYNGQYASRIIRLNADGSTNTISS